MCGSRHYYQHFVSQENEMLLYEDSAQLKYFVMSSQVCYETKLLFRCQTDILVLCAAYR